jgi:anti-sigma B factor antagonist
LTYGFAILIIIEIPWEIYFRDSGMLRFFPVCGPKEFSFSSTPIRLMDLRLDESESLILPHRWFRHCPNLTGNCNMSAGHRRLDIEESGDVTIAKFVDKKILDEGNIQIIGNQLFSLVEDDGRTKIVLDFSNVEYLSSAALGKLITMDKKVKAAKGKLRLCTVRPDIYEVFAITKLNKLFDMRDTLEQALEGM